MLSWYKIMNECYLTPVKLLNIGLVKNDSCWKGCIWQFGNALLSLSFQRKHFFSLLKRMVYVLYMNVDFALKRKCKLSHNEITMEYLNRRKSRKKKQSTNDSFPWRVDGKMLILLVPKIVKKNTFNASVLKHEKT